MRRRARSLKVTLGSWIDFRGQWIRLGQVFQYTNDDQVENGWTVTTVDGTVFIFPDAKEMAEWFCMVVGVPFLYRKVELDPLEEEIRKLTKATASLLA